LIINHLVVPKLVELLHTAEFEVQKEAAWAISNATSGGTPDQIIYLVQQGAIAALCGLLTSSDSKIVTVVLKGLDNILKVGLQRPGAVHEHTLRMFSECGGLEKIEALQDHTNASIYQRALRMLTTYFGAISE
jgi:cytosine/adenosine deaminase-related metal-dependent hydrolase